MVIKVFPTPVGIGLNTYCGVNNGHYGFPERCELNALFCVMVAEFLFVGKELMFNGKMDCFMCFALDSHRESLLKRTHKSILKTP